MSGAGAGLLGQERGYSPVVSRVEGAERSAEPDSTLANEQVKQPNAGGEAQPREGDERAVAIHRGGPVHGEQGGEPLNPTCFLQIAATLDQFQHHETGEAWGIGERAQPGTGLRQSAQQVYEDVGVEQAHRSLA